MNHNYLRLILRLSAVWFLVSLAGIPARALDDSRLFRLQKYNTIEVEALDEASAEETNAIGTEGEGLSATPALNAESDLEQNEQNAEPSASVEIFHVDSKLFENGVAHDSSNESVDAAALK